MEPPASSSAPPPVDSIVVLLAVHNRLTMTQRCIGALRQASRKREIRIVVVDDGSTDGTADWLAAEPGVEVMEGDGNLWFGGATDLGLRHIVATKTDSRWVLILNNDTFPRMGALDEMIAVAGADRVVAGSFWLEDRNLPGSAGFSWQAWRGLRDVCITVPWLAEHAAGSRRFLPVDAVATSLTLLPLALLKKTSLPDATLHPHNRYDAILSARMRDAGASFLCSTEFLGDHLYGPMTRRPTVRNMTMGRFLHESFVNRHSIYHYLGNLALIRETSPSPVETVWGVLRQTGRFCRQAAWTTLNSLRTLPKRAARASAPA